MIESLPLTGKSRLRKAADHTAIEVDGQVMLMSESQGRYFGLDDIASDIWRRLDQPQTIAELNASLLKDYAGAPDVIGHDVAILLKALQGYGLLEVADRALSVKLP